MKNDKLINRPQNDVGVVLEDNTNSIIQRPCHRGSYILGHFERLMTCSGNRWPLHKSFLLRRYQKSANSFKKHWSVLADNGCVRKTVWLGKDNYANSGNFYTWFSAPKINYCVVIVENGVILAKQIFKGYSGEQRRTKLSDSISLSVGKTISGKFSIDWTETFESIGIPHTKRDCLNCDDAKIYSHCVI